MKEDEQTPASPDGADPRQAHSSAAFEPPPPPAWAESVPARRPRRRRGKRIALTAGLVVVLAAAAGGTIAATRGHDPAKVPSAAPAATGYDLRTGGVFIQSNEAAANRIVAFARRADGTLKEVGRFKTGGTGSGSFEDSAKGLLLGSPEGEASPTHLLDQADFLFASNAGNDTISVLRVLPDRLQLVDQVPSGGEKPVSLTVNHGLLYVLNSGEFNDQLIVGPPTLGPASVQENCTTGQLPSVTGFRVSPSGMLTQINGSTRLLSGEKESGCAEVSFTPDGKTLVATERIAGKHEKNGAGKGAILSFPVRADGTLGAMAVGTPASDGPFGFTFTKDGTLLASEQNGANPGTGRAASYALGADGAFHPIAPAVANGGSDTCWMVVTDDGTLAFSSSLMNDGVISSYRVGKDGSLHLLHTAASADDGRSATADHNVTGLSDQALSRDSKYLYQLNSIFGLLYVYSVNANGTLTPIEQHQVFDLEPPFEGGQLTPFGLTAS